MVNKIFRIRNETSNELRQRSCFYITSGNSVFSGTESIRLYVLIMSRTRESTLYSYLNVKELLDRNRRDKSKNLGALPNDIKYLPDLKDFKTEKKLKSTSCPYRICKTYLYGV